MDQPAPTCLARRRQFQPSLCRYSSSSIISLMRKMPSSPTPRSSMSSDRFGGGSDSGSKGVPSSRRNEFDLIVLSSKSDFDARRVGRVCGAMHRDVHKQLFERQGEGVGGFVRQPVGSPELLQEADDFLELVALTAKLDARLTQAAIASDRVSTLGIRRSKPLTWNTSRTVSVRAQIAMRMLAALAPRALTRNARRPALETYLRAECRTGQTVALCDHP